MFEKAKARQTRASGARRRSSSGLLLAVCFGVAGCGVGPDTTGVRLPIANGIAAHNGTVFIGGITSGTVFELPRGGAPSIGSVEPGIFGVPHHAASVAALRVSPVDGTLWGTALRLGVIHAGEGPACVFQLDASPGACLRTFPFPD